MEHLKSAKPLIKQDTPNGEKPLLLNLPKWWSKPLIACIPNFSEGQNLTTIKQISTEIKQIKEVALLHVDIGHSTNRSVFTIAGEPAAVCRALERAAAVAIELIDMQKHRGVHPRLGALDVCPLVPLANISMPATAAYARKLAKYLANNLGLTIYCYGEAAFKEARRDLAHIRKGGYEGLPAKLLEQEQHPDFGPPIFNPQSGASIVGARNILLAYNVTLNTREVELAKLLAKECKKAFWQSSQPTRSLKSLGWYIPEYQRAQVSFNITDIQATPLHLVFNEVCRLAHQHKISVHSSELIGLIPLKCLIEAGIYFSAEENLAASSHTKASLLKLAIQKLKLDDLTRFIPQRKIIEYTLRKFFKEHR